MIDLELLERSRQARHEADQLLSQFRHPSALDPNTEQRIRERLHDLVDEDL